MSTYCRFLNMTKTTSCRIWLLVAPIRQGVGANQQRKTPNGANPFPPTRLKIRDDNLNFPIQASKSPCVLMKKVGPTKTPQRTQHEINQLWQLLTTPPSYTSFCVAPIARKADSMSETMANGPPVHSSSHFR